MTHNDIYDFFIKNYPLGLAFIGFTPVSENSILIRVLGLGCALFVYFSGEPYETTLPECRVEYNCCIVYDEKTNSFKEYN